MTFLTRLFRHAPWRYAAAFAAGAMIALLSLLRTGFGYRLAWADALTTAGGVLLFLSLLGLTAHLGAFDIFGFSVSALGRRRYKNLYEYSAAHQEKRRRTGWTFGPLLLTGAVFLLAGLILWAM